MVNEAFATQPFIREFTSSKLSIDIKKMKLVSFLFGAKARKALGKLYTLRAAEGKLVIPESISFVGVNSCHGGLGCERARWAQKIQLWVEMTGKEKGLAEYGGSKKKHSMGYAGRPQPRSNIQIIYIVNVCICISTYSDINLFVSHQLLISL